MSVFNFFKPATASSSLNGKSWSHQWHIDLPLLIGILALIAFGLVILYSASNQNTHLVLRQVIRIGFAFLLMLLIARIPYYRYKLLIPWLYALGVLLLIAVLIVGHIGKGAQRWLNLGLFKFQPSEMMKILTPMMVAFYLSQRGLALKWVDLAASLFLLAMPAALISKQPDLGTAIMVAASGLWVIFLAGVRWRIIIISLVMLIILAPIVWHFLHDYQRERVLIFLNPERSPLGAGYHIIQSKIAIGSGGLLGKGYLQGTQSHLQFLPEHATDFIFAVCSEELGLAGDCLLIALYLFITLRGLYISFIACDTFSRLLAGSLTLTFFCSFFINMGMVTGIVPVVGLPLPLVSYGGTAVVATLSAFGILMSISTDKRIYKH